LRARRELTSNARSANISPYKNKGKDFLFNWQLEFGGGSQPAMATLEALVFVQCGSSWQFRWSELIGYDDLRSILQLGKVLPRSSLFLRQEPPENWPPFF
jgi:hypothetical protein